MTPLRIGVVGVGNLGEHHARLYSEMAAEGVVLAGVADPNIERARELAARFGTTAFAGLAELCAAASPDAVSIVVPTLLHHAIAREALDRGLHVLVEKPITVTVEEADDLIARAAQASRVLQVGHVERYNVAAEELAKLRDTPRFIEADRLSPYSPRNTEVGVVLDLMIHDLDIVLALVQSPVREIRASGVPILSATDDIANARIEFEDGCVANLTASRVSVERLRKIRVFQRDAYLSMDYIKQEIVLYKLRPGTGSGAGPSADDIESVRLAINHEQPLRAELRDFAACVQAYRSGAPRLPRVTGEDGRRALAIALEIERRAREARARDPILAPV